MAWRALVAASIAAYVKGGDALPLVHEDDVVEVFRRLVLEDHRGAFNVDAGLLPWTELAQIFQRRARPLPYWVARTVSAVGYRLGLLPSSEHWVELARYPVAIDTTRARTELGWRPTRTPAEAAREMFDAGQRRRAA